MCVCGCVYVIYLKYPPFHPSIHPSIHTSSGTALMLVKPFLKQTKTLLAPHRSADVAQSNAVSPAPKTITTPLRFGSEEQHLCIPIQRGASYTCVFTYLTSFFPTANFQTLKWQQLNDNKVIRRLKCTYLDSASNSAA